MKKAIALGLSAVMAAGMVACGSAPSSTPTSTSGGDSAAPSSGKEITYWSMWNETDPQATAIKEAADAYTAETGVKVNIEFKGRDINTVIKAALDAGEKIDVFDDDFQRMSEKFGSDCLDLTEMAAAVGYEDKALSVLVESVKDWTGGKLTCIPYQPYTSGIFYTQSAFDAAGITEEPKTWEEFLTVCQQLKDAGYTPLAQDSAYTTYTYGFMLARMIGQDAVKELANEGNWSASAEAKQAADMVLELREKGYLSETCPDEFPNGENELGFGTAAMVVNASWVPNEITTNTGCDEQWGMFDFPAMTDADKDSITVANIGGQGLGVNAKSENPQEAFDFIMFLTTGEYDKKISEACNAVPADTTNDWPEMLAGVKDNFVALTDTYEWNMGLNANQEISTSVDDNIKKLFEGAYADGQAFVEAMDALY